MSTAPAQTGATAVPAAPAATAAAAPAAPAVAVAPAAAPAVAAAPAPAPLLSRADAIKWHGYMLADANLPPPTCVLRTDAIARPKSSVRTNASEYVDTPEALHAKADLLASLVRRAERGAIFLGAGISTSAGCRDYASSTPGSSVQPAARKLTKPFIRSMRPTPAHRVLAAMYRSGVFKVSDTCQQNHDGLLNKAGMPADKVNEIHGAWLDESGKNRVVPMSGELRSDLFQRILELEKVADLCISIGSSHSGLNVDRIPQSVGQRHRDAGIGLGTCIVTIQQTPLDEFAGIRVFSKCDDFMMLLAGKLGLSIDFDTDYDYATGVAKKFPASENFHRFKTGRPYEVAGAVFGAASSSSAAGRASSVPPRAAAAAALGATVTPPRGSPARPVPVVTKAVAAAATAAANAAGRAAAEATRPAPAP
jgi:NAD-dependent SIR2 family protein deacetylase